MNNLKMPIGVDDFAEIITQGFYYVDKTGMIKELLNNWGKVNLFTRPRRFGKSINMNMLKAFFEIGTDKSLFDGLAVSKEAELCEMHMGQYPVISISLKQVSGSSFQEAKEQLWSTIAEAAEQLDYLQESERLNARDKNKIFALSEGKGNQQEGLRLMSRMLYKHYGKKVIILIDEYDAPLQKAYENDYYDEMVGLIRQLFGYALKSNDALFFSVLTGCMRISKESIFSDLNNPVIHSISDEQFDEWFGFTDEETVQMLERLGLSEYYDAARLEDCLNYQLGESISYLDGGNYEDKETFYHGLLIGILGTRKGWDIKSERESGNGRADITAFNLRTKEAYIIEVKYTKDDQNLTADAQDAIDQINRLQYDRYFSNREPKSIRHYGIAFCLKQCRVLTE